MRRQASFTFVLAAGALLAPLAACSPAPADTPPPPEPVAACPPTRNWTAWINAMPGAGAVPTLIVTGEAEIPAGMVATLTEGPLDRMMPPGQRFNLALAPGSGPSSWQQVRAEVKPAQTAYRMVLIGCDGKEIARIDEVGTAH